MKKNIILFFITFISVFQLMILGKMKYDIHNTEQVNKEVNDILKKYESETYLKFKPTLFDISNRGGFEIDEALSSLLYNNQEIPKISNPSLEKLRRNIGDDIFCKVADENDIYMINFCLSLFSKMTMKKLEDLKMIQLKDSIKEINYSDENKLVWRIVISSDNNYELNISKDLQNEIKSFYSINIPEKIYGELNEDYIEKVKNINKINYHKNNKEEILFLKEITPFIQFK